MLSHRDSDKARHYLDLLDAARCEARWQDVPELVRKVEKHAPQRRCLALTARTETRIASVIASRPSTSANAAKDDLNKDDTQLSSVAEKEKSFPEDAFQAQICLIWLRSILEKTTQVLSGLSPQDLSQAISRFINIVSPTARWTHVCIVKGVNLRGMALESSGNTKEAVQLYKSVMGYLSQTQSTVGITPESNRWTEGLLARYCSLISRHLRSHAKDFQAILGSTYIPAASLLSPFRLWAAYRNERREINSFDAKWIWKEYYDALSILVQHRILHSILPNRSELRAELQKVQSVYETTLLKETSFPQANEVNVEVESWVDQVMANWRSMLDPPWHDEDLGQGGKNAMGKGILDILYRAATRTFHSTRVLRHLFTVHTALAEFALAGKALDTYIEIVSKGKARTEKSGENESGLDDAATVLTTVAAGIRVLCSFGRRREVERASEITEILEPWLKKALLDQTENSNRSTDASAELFDEKLNNKRPISPSKPIALAYQALGISQSCWARLTYETSSRPVLQDKAISNFKKALQQDLDDEVNLEILNSLALVLAETREIEAAIKIAKSAVSIGYDDQDDESDQNLDVNPNRRESVLKSWHLLILLLTARQNLPVASASCEAAFDPYGGRSILNGDFTYLMSSVPGLKFAERSSLVEVKMTQLAISDALDGPDEAVNGSGELLSLYARLFKYPGKGDSSNLEPKVASPAPSTTGTQRSFRGSIVGYPKDRKSRLQADGLASSSVGSFDPPLENSTTPAIAITSEDTILPQNPNHYQNFLGRHESKKLRKRNSRKSMGSQRRTRENSPVKPSSSHDGHLLPTHLKREAGSSLDESHDTLAPPYALDEVGVAISYDLPSTPATHPASSDPPNSVLSIPSAARNLAHKNPNLYPVAPKPPPGSTPVPPHSMPFLIPSDLSVLPEPYYPAHLQLRHSLSLLTRIWCQISSMYRRAFLTSESRAAIKEAQIAVQSIENQIASREGSSAANFSTPGYGNLKALGELWADVLGESGALHASMEDKERAAAAYEAALAWWPNHAASIIGLGNILLDTYEASKQKPPSKPSPLEDNVPRPKPILLPLPTPSPGISQSSPPSPSSSTSPSPTGSRPTSPFPTLEITPPPANHIRKPSISFSPVSESKKPPHFKTEKQQSGPKDKPGQQDHRGDSTITAGGEQQQDEDLTPLSARDRAYSLLSILTKSGQGWDNSEAWYALARAYELSGQPDKATEALWWVVELEGGRGVREWGCVGRGM